MKEFLLQKERTKADSIEFCIIKVLLGKNKTIC